MADKEFDMVFDCQRIFKGVMNAMAKPGTIFNINEQSSKLVTEDNVPLALAMTLMDNRSTLYVQENEELLSVIREKTMAAKSNMDMADFVIVPNVERDKEYYSVLLNSAKIGTLPEPHKSAMVIVGLNEIDGKKKIKLEGPGIKECKEIMFSEAGVAWLYKRAEQHYEFPCGTDILFYTDKGEILGIPRTVKAEVN